MNYTTKHIEDALKAKARADDQGVGETHYEATHNNPPVKFELDRDLAEFIVENVDANIPLCLVNMEHFARMRDRDGAQKAVDMLEKYRKIKKAIEEALK